MVTIVNILKENNQPNKKPDANCRTGGTGVAGEALVILIFGRYVKTLFQSGGQILLLFAPPIFQTFRQH